MLFNGRTRLIFTGAALALITGLFWGTAGCGHQVVQTRPAARSAGSIVAWPPTPGPGSTASPADLRDVPRVPASTVLDLPEDSPSAVYHEVQPGDTISGIARKYGRSTQAILDANGMEASSILHPKQLIYIP